MDKQKTVTVNIINRNYPPGAGITGESAAELAEYLAGKGIKVNVICVDGPVQHDSKDGPSITAYSVKTFYSGKIKVLRLLSSLFEGYSLVRRSKKLSPDITICMTDPPLLNMWAALLLGKKHRWVLWSMDLYPEAFVAGRLINASNFLYKQIDKIVTRNIPSYIISLGPVQASYLRNKYRADIDVVHLPCGIYRQANGSPEPVTEAPAWAEDRSKIYLGYCGNLGEAHSPEFLRAVIEQLDPEKHRLILAVYGIHAGNMIEFAKDRPGVTVLPVVKRPEMKYIDVHIASLKSEWTNVCVPSKAVSSICSGAALLFNGIADSDNWVLLEDAGWRVSDASLQTEVKAFFEQLDSAAIAERKMKAARLADELLVMKTKAFDDICRKTAALV
jgi:hypothetical protein